MKRRVHRVAWWRCDRVADYGARPAASWQSPSDWCVCSRFCADARTICDGISQQLNTLGYAEGTDYVLLVRWGEGNFDRFSDYARELVEAGPDVILAIGTAVANAVKGQTSTIPAIFVQVADPVGGGFVKSLSRPGSNFTGFANYEPGMTGKWLELLKDSVPDLKRVALMFNPQTTSAGGAHFWEVFKKAAASVAVQPIAGSFYNVIELDEVLAALSKDAGRRFYPGAGRIDHRQPRRISRISGAAPTPRCLPLP